MYFFTLFASTCGAPLQRSKRFENKSDAIRTALDCVSYFAKDDITAQKQENQLIEITKELNFPIFSWWFQNRLFTLTIQYQSSIGNSYDEAFSKQFQKDLKSHPHE